MHAIINSFKSSSCPPAPKCSQSESGAIANLLPCCVPAFFLERNPPTQREEDPWAAKDYYKKITDARNRIVTFNKRKSGLLKKTMELSLLCDAKIALIINCEGKIMQYCSEEIDKFFLTFSEAGEADESYDNTDYTKMFENGGSGPAQTQLSSHNASSSSKRSSSTKTPDDVLKKLKEDIDMKAASKNSRPLCSCSSNSNNNSSSCKHRAG